MRTRMMKVGFVGAAVAALCCFTPVLVVLLGFVGLGGAIGWLDHVLLPALGLFLAIVVYAAFAKEREISP